MEIIVRNPLCASYVEWAVASLGPNPPIGAISNSGAWNFGSARFLATAAACA
jgi:hypothetical protein